MMGKDNYVCKCVGDNKGMGARMGRTLMYNNNRKIKTFTYDIHIQNFTKHSLTHTKHVTNSTVHLTSIIENLNSTVDSSTTVDFTFD